MIKLYNLWKNNKKKTGYNMKGVIWSPNVTQYKVGMKKTMKNKKPGDARQSR